jgi:hypothetical protein
VLVALAKVTAATIGISDAQSGAPAASMAPGPTSPTLTGQADEAAGDFCATRFLVDGRIMGNDHCSDRRRSVQHRGEAGADLGLAEKFTGVGNGSVDQAEQQEGPPL